MLDLKRNRVLVVAILGSEDLKVKDIDPTTIMIGREGIAGGVAPVRYAFRKVSTTIKSQKYGWNNYKRDKYKDMILIFNKAELADALLLGDEAGQTIQLVITGNLKEKQGGTPLAGEDSITILNK